MKKTTVSLNNDRKSKTTQDILRVIEEIRKNNPDFDFRYRLRRDQLHDR